MKIFLDILQVLQGTPVPNLLVIVGFLFIFLAFVGKFGKIIKLPKERQKWAGMIGALFLLSGIGLFMLPVFQSVLVPTDTPVPPTATSVPLTDTPPPTNTLVPLTDTPTLTDTPPPTNTPLPPPQPTCKGSTSQELTEQMFEAYDQGNYEKALVCTNELEQRWTLQAQEQQVEKAQSDCDYTPDPENQVELDKFWADYWALNDVAIGWFVRGEILREQGHCAEARAAYMVVIDEYSCAYAWDPKVSRFWKIAEGAQNGHSKNCP